MLENLKLTSEQIQILKRRGGDFKNWIESEKGKKDIQEHREHEQYFKEMLSAENLDKMTDNEFAEVWKKSWASKILGNKDIIRRSFTEFAYSVFGCIIENLGI